MRFFATISVFVIVAGVAYGSPAPAGLISGVLSGTTDLVGQLRDDLNAALSGLSDGVGNVITAVTDLLGNILIPVLTAVGAIVTIVVSAAGVVVAVLGLVGTALTQVTINLVNSILDAISTAGVEIPAAITDLLSNLLGTVTGTVGGAVGTVCEIAG